MSLLEARKQYKPFEYPWAFDFWKRQQQIHWMPEEVPLGEDCRDWAQKLSDHERNLLTQIFRFFTQADVEVQDCYHEKYGRIFKPTEIKMMLAAFSNMETVHIAAYSHLLDTIGMPESEYGAFLEYSEMKDKHDYLQGFGVDTDEDIAKTLAMFGGFTEGLQLFASFAMLMNFPRFNKMKGMGQIVSWSVRDESLHCEGIIKLFHAFCQGARLPDQVGQVGHHGHVPDDRAAGGCVHRPRLRDGPGQRHDAQGDQEVHPLHRRLAAGPARPEADLHDRRAPLPGSPRCSTAWSTPTSSNSARRSIRRPRRAGTGTRCGTGSTSGKRRSRARLRMRMPGTALAAGICSRRLVWRRSKSALADVRYQVLVSSTYDDLRSERQQATQAILEMDHMPAGMELFPASDLFAMELIKAVINDSDYYIVIVGGRYGSVNEQTGLSFTEMEFDYAVSTSVPVLDLCGKIFPQYRPDTLSRTH